MPPIFRYSFEKADTVIHYKVTDDPPDFQGPGGVLLGQGVT